MSDSNGPTCPSCGARVGEGAEVCDLCGTSVAETSGEKSATEAGGRYCTQCGAEHPSGANFCSRCGARLTASAEASVEASSEPSRRAVPVAPLSSEEASATGDSATPAAGVSRRMWTIIGVAVLLVVGLFALSSWSQTQESAVPAVPSAAPAEAGAGGAGVEALIEAHRNLPVPDGIEAEVDSLETLIAQAEELERQQLRIARINLLIGAGQLPRAALAQRRLAQETGNTSAWRRAARLLHDWMSATPAREERVSIARLAIEAYQEVLARVPNDADARAMLATAYIETNNPMRGVQEIKRVLEQNPEHVQALFNYGIMLAMIGRVDEAAEQFEKIQQITDPQSPQHREAERIIREIRRQTQSGAGNGAPEMDGAGVVQ